MAESQRITYVRLFEVRVLHHYWLDEGDTDFDSIADGAVRTERLLTYDVRRLLSFTPSRATTILLKGIRGVFRTTGLGFLVGVPDDTVIPLAATFEFHVIVTDPEYDAYTAQPTWREGVTAPTIPALRPQPIVSVLEDASDPGTGTRPVHNYKANVPVLSNLTGGARGAGNTQRLYLSRSYPVSNDQDALEALVPTGNDLQQRSGDPGNSPLTRVGPLAMLPIFVHQGDVPAITPPAGSIGAPAFGIELADDTPTAVNAVIRLVPRRPNASAFDFALQNGLPNPTVYEVHLLNRRTTWRYHNKSDGSAIPPDVGPLPLTHFGNAGSKQKPRPTALAAVYDNNTPPRITRLVSDIYV